MRYTREDERRQRQQAHIASAPNVAEAVRRAAAYVGVNVEHDYQAAAIANAARSFADTVVHVRQTAHRFQWEEADGFRDYLRQAMRRELLDAVASQGLIPVALPSETLRYSAGFLDGFREMPEDSGWQEVTVTLEVPVRTPPVDREAAVKAGLLDGIKPGG